MFGSPGLVQWFHFEDRERVRQAARIINDLKVKEVRLLFSWADWERPGGQAWFDFFVNEIAIQTGARLIPDIFYTPLPKARPDEDGQKRTSHPPKNLADFAVFVDEIIKRYGHFFDWIQIWNEPNWKPYWDWDIDPMAELFSEMAGLAADVIHKHGKKSALGGLTPYEPEYITMIARHGLIPKIDAVGIHYSPSWRWQRRKWYGFEVEIETARAHLRGLFKNNGQLPRKIPEVWIAETGFATVLYDGESNNIIEENSQALYKRQIEFFEEVRKTSAEKILWFSIFDENLDKKTDAELNMVNVNIDQTAYFFGLVRTNGEPKSLYSHWKELGTSL